MNREGVEKAAYNNAVWCDTICRTHGTAGEFLDDIWINRRETPPFYPNAVTLSRNTSVQLKCIPNVIEAAIPSGLAVKDSFAALDLAPFGFRILLEADWVWREALRPRPGKGASEARLVRVTEASELA